MRRRTACTTSAETKPRDDQCHLDNDAKVHAPLDAAKRGG